MKIQERDIVRTLVDREGFLKGSKGVVVSIYFGYPVCEVEIWDKTNYPIDVITYKFDELEVIEHTNEWSLLVYSYIKKIIKNLIK